MHPTSSWHLGTNSVPTSRVAICSVIQDLVFRNNRPIHGKWMVFVMAVNFVYIHLFANNGRAFLSMTPNSAVSKSRYFLIIFLSSRFHFETSFEITTSIASQKFPCFQNSSEDPQKMSTFHSQIVLCLPFTARSRSLIVQDFGRVSTKRNVPKRLSGGCEWFIIFRYKLHNNLEDFLKNTFTYIEKHFLAGGRSPLLNPSRTHQRFVFPHEPQSTLRYDAGPHYFKWRRLGTKSLLMRGRIRRS